MYKEIGIQALSKSAVLKLLRGERVRVKHGSVHHIHVSHEQHKRIMAAHHKGKAHTLQFDPYQLEMHKKGSGVFDSVLGTLKTIGRYAKPVIKKIAPPLIDLASNGLKGAINGWGMSDYDECGDGLISRNIGHSVGKSKALPKRGRGLTDIHHGIHHGPFLHELGGGLVSSSSKAGPRGSKSVAKKTGKGIAHRHHHEHGGNIGNDITNAFNSFGDSVRSGFTTAFSAPEINHELNTFNSLRDPATYTAPFHALAPAAAELYRQRMALLTQPFVAPVSKGHWVTPVGHWVTRGRGVGRPKKHHHDHEHEHGGALFPAGYDAGSASEHHHHLHGMGVRGRRPTGKKGKGAGGALLGGLLSGVIDKRVPGLGAIAPILGGLLPF